MIYVFFCQNIWNIISKSGWFTYNILTVPYASSMIIITNDLYFNLSHIFDYLLQEKWLKHRYGGTKY